MPSSLSASSKCGRTYYDETMVARVSEKLRRHGWARKQAAEIQASCAWLLAMSDDELWSFVPPPEQIRAINVCIAHDCPICGDEITRQAGHYPWIMSREKPFKVKCPVCENTFPSNDFEPWNLGGLDGPPETEPGYVDRGLGWLDTDGRRYYFVPYYIFWQRWVKDVLGGLTNLGQAYLLTGDTTYAHKCAVMMAKIASEYDRFDYANQAYHEGIKGVRGRISDYIWSTGNDATIALAYDAIYPALADDQELRSLLNEKGLGDPCTLIETKMLHLMIKDVTDGFVRGNMGSHQGTMCHLAIVLPNDDPERGPTTKEMRDWLMRGPGRVEDLLWNGFWREGLGGESSPSYSSGWCNSFYAIAALLPKLGVDIWSNPKLKKMADIGLDLTVGGEFCPSIGDCGSVLGAPRVAWAATLQGPAFTHYRDPRHAKALKLMEAVPGDLWEDHFDSDEVERIVAAEGTELGLRTRNLGGYGLAILESGGGDRRRAVSMYYGDATGGHGHRDRLNIEMFAYGRPMLPEDGYPTPFTRPDFHEWRIADTVKHYCVMIDEQPHRNLQAGQLNTLAVSPQVQLMDASAESVYEGLASLYRRTTALIDISEEDFYLLDIFRVRGGAQHDWCFHGPPFPEFSVGGGTLGPVQSRGTLAGEDVPYGGRPSTPHGISSGFQGLFNVRRMRPDGAWLATWHKPDEDLSLTMAMPAGCAQEVIAAEGEPELVPGSPKTIQYALGRNVKADAALASKYVAVIEPHRGPAGVRGVELMPGESATSEAVGLIVHRERERELIHSSPASEEKCEWQAGDATLVVVAEFALVTLDEHGVRRACVVNGTLLEYGDFRLHPVPPLAGKVLSVDLHSNSITIDTALDPPESCRSLVAILGNELHQTSYTIVEAEVVDGATRLCFGDVLFTVGMGVVAEIDQSTGRIISDRELTGYGRTDGGRHAGRWLYNEDKSRGFRIASVDGHELVLEGGDGDLAGIFRDTDGDGRRQYWISDIGPGDTFRIPTVTHYTR